MANFFAKIIEPPRNKIPMERQMFSNQDLKKLIIPLVIEQVLVMFVGMADTMMVSHAGEAAISGVSLVDMINGVFLYVFNALAAGGTIVVSQYMGSGDMDRAKRSSSQLVMISTLLSFIFFGFIMIGNRPLLSLLFGQIEADVMDAAMTYLVITAFSFPFMALHSACTALFRAMGNSKLTMKVSLGMNILNVIGNAIGVFVLHAGVVGVAMASLISRFAASVVMFVLLLDKNRTIHIKIRDVFSFNKDLLKKILHIAIPNGVQSGLFQITRVLLTSIIATFGTAQIAANGVAVSIDNINTIINSAVSMAIPTVIGRCVGANDYKQATYYAKKMLLIAQFSSIVLNVSLFLSLPLILNMYALSAEATRYAYILVSIHSLWTILLGTSSGPLPSVLNAAGDVHFTMKVAAAGLIIGRLFCSYIFSITFGWGIIGMWIAMATHWSFNSFFGYYRFRSGKWMDKRIV